MKKEKFVTIGMAALVATVITYGISNDKFLSNIVDTYVFEKTGSSLFQPIEQVRFNFLQTTALKGLDKNSFSYESTKELFESINTPEYLSNLKDQNFYKDELETVLLTKDIELKKMALIEDEVNAEVKRLFPDEEVKTKKEPKVIDLITPLPPEKLAQQKSDNFGLGTIDEEVNLSEMPTPQKISNTSLKELREKYIENNLSQNKKTDFKFEF